MKSSHFVIAASLATLSLSTVRAASPTYEESFSKLQDGANLRDLSGWSAHNGPGGALITVSAGISGLGVRVENNEQFRLALSDDQAVPLANGGGELRLRIRIMAENDGYALSQVLLGQDDGVHGVVVRFNGGTHDGSPDNYIQVSNGGESWGKAIFETIPDSAWKKETWYEVAISIMAPDRASVSIREVDGKTSLVENHTAGVVGPADSFERLDAVVIGNAGTARTFDFDDLSLSPL